MSLPPLAFPDLEVRARALRAVWTLSGTSRRWVRSDRVVARAAGRRVELWNVLERQDWWRDPMAAEYAALVSLVHSELVEGCGHFGTPDSPPVDAVFNRCRRVERDLDAALAELAAVVTSD